MENKKMSAGDLSAMTVFEVANYLKENYHPHMAVIVTADSVRMVEDVGGFPILHVDKEKNF